MADMTLLNELLTGKLAFFVLLFLTNMYILILLQWITFNRNFWVYHSSGDNNSFLFQLDFY
jgi:hypothetical protein